MINTKRMSLFWGKSAPRHLEGETRYKPIHHHLLDVAAAAMAWQTANIARMRREAEILRVDVDDLVRTNAFLVALHDLGKYAAAFQAQRPDLWPADVLGPIAPQVPLSHWRATALMMADPAVSDILRELFPKLRGKHAPLVAAIAGHHGRPPTIAECTAGPDEAVSHPAIGAIAMEVVRDAAAMLREVIQPKALPTIGSAAMSTASWRLSALTSLADWVGSDADAFPIVDPMTSIDDYWSSALEKAKRAIADNGLASALIAGVPSLYDLTGRDGERPSPLQQRVMEMDLPSGPVVVVIEDITGSGKTEAASILASRMMAAGMGEGIYVALPTEATSNAMYRRVTRFYRKLFSSTDRTSLVLAHGRSRLSHAFLSSIGRGAETDAGEDGETTASYCSEWIADSRRKAFFADVGVGTIDQAFLGILPKKYLVLRQYALAGRILVIDEAHAYDAYMGVELDMLLRTHVAHGGSAIVLSATLSGKQSDAIVATLRDDEEEEARSGEPRPYPCLTTISIAGVDRIQLGWRTDLERTVDIHRIGSREESWAKAVEAASRGAAVLVVTSTIADAVRTYDEIGSRITDPDRVHLFHAQLAQVDRQRIEQGVLDRFGREAKADGRNGHILVATQVVEQSVDIDFDVLITDLAPIDLLIQRIGRIWRHMSERPADTRPTTAPVAYVVSPSPNAASSAGWLDECLGRGTAYVYRHMGVLWRTADIVFAAGRISIPHDIRGLIEGVYDSRRTPPGLKAAEVLGANLDEGDEAKGDRSVIAVEKGYHSLPSSLDTDEDIGTRLGGRRRTVRLARRTASGIEPYALTEEDRLAWPSSEMNMGSRRLDGLLEGVVETKEVARIRSGWPRIERSIPIVEVEDDGGIISTSDKVFRYDRTRGIVEVDG